MADATRNAYGRALADLIRTNERVVVLDADLTKSTKTCDAKKACPERHFNAGIAEGNMMGLAAGLAASGKIVYASSFAMFAAGRAFEQVRNSICYPKLNVKICATHAGITVGEDGASHQTVEDIALMRSIPNMTVIVPCDCRQADQAVRQAAEIDGPVYIRLGRGNVEDVYTEGETAFTPGQARVLREGKDAAIVACGMMVQEALKAAKVLEEEGISLEVIDMPSIKPLDTKTLKDAAQKFPVLFTAEEHSIYGGLHGAISEYLSAEEPVRIVPIGLRDTFGESGTPAELLEKYGLNADSIVKTVRNGLKIQA